MTVGGHNSTVQAGESPKPQGTDVIGAILMALMQQCEPFDLVGRSRDLKSAYKKLGLSAVALRDSFVSCFNPRTKRAEVFKLPAVPLGATRSVFAFLSGLKAFIYHGVVSTMTL